MGREGSGGPASDVRAPSPALRPAPPRADLDPLTGLRNARALERDLAPLLRGSAGPFALVTVDVDEYAGYVDRVGAAAGEALLRNVGRAIDDSTREGDPAYRYALDVFAILLLGEGERHAADVASRVADAFGAFAASDGAPGVIVGTARWPEDGSAMRELLRAAEAGGEVFAPTAEESDDAERARLFERVIAAATALVSAPGREEIVRATLDAAQDLTGIGDLFLAAPRRGELVQAAGCGIFAESSLRIRTGDSVWARAWETGRVLAASAGDPGLPFATSEIPGSLASNESPGEMLLGVPLPAPETERGAGLLGLVIPDPAHLTPPLLEALCRLADVAGAALAANP